MSLEDRLLTIAWDVDDVLNDLMGAWFDHWRKGRSCKIEYGDLRDNPPSRILGISLEEYLSSLDEFRVSPRYQEMKPPVQVLDWFKGKGSMFRHIALTAVPLKASAASANWVLRNLGTWIRTFHFVPSPRRDEDIPVYDENKASFIEWLGKIDIFIDDNPENVRAADAVGTKTFLFPRPWNNGRMSVEEILGEL